MRVVVATDPGVLELNYLWLPTFIGMSNAVKKEIEDLLAKELEGKPLDEDAAHNLVVSFLVKRFSNVRGLEEFLDGLKYVEYT